MARTQQTQHVLSTSEEKGVVGLASDLLNMLAHESWPEVTVFGFWQFKMQYDAMMRTMQRSPGYGSDQAPDAVNFDHFEHNPFRMKTFKQKLPIGRYWEIHGNSISTECNTPHLITIANGIIRISQTKVGLADSSLSPRMQCPKFHRKSGITPHSSNLSPHCQGVWIQRLQG